jgi:hypothetical protein
MGKLIDADAAIESLTEYGNGRAVYISVEEAVRRIEQLPSAQPEHKDAIEKAVAVEAISGELMSRFDISATYAYEVAETAVNRIEMMAKEMGRKVSRNDSD